MNSQGSSPLTRGAPRRENNGLITIWLIPAYAGSTLFLFLEPLSSRAHPRLRGEHFATPGDVCLLRGSSPLTRGAPGRRRAIHLLHRLIPAYAGSTPHARHQSPPVWAHPRLRGEHRMTKERCRPMLGSSPLTRGARDVLDDAVSVHGLIPAYAGSTTPPQDSPQNKRAHPRLRGEHCGRRLRRARMIGSSPLTRGARFLSGGGAVVGRLIPAYAGSTRRRMPVDRLSTAHPRLRGEHTMDRFSGFSAPGSSPLTRGAQSGERIVLRAARLIPAYAGSTLADMHVSEPKVDFRSDLVERRTSSVDCDERYEQCSIRCAAETLTARPAAA